MKFVYYTQYEKQLPTYDEVVEEIEARRTQYVELTEWYHTLYALKEGQLTEEELLMQPNITEMFFYRNDQNYGIMQDEVFDALEALNKVEDELTLLKVRLAKKEVTEEMEARYGVKFVPKEVNNE